MPDDNKEKWNPGKLYATPAFPENEGTQEIYPETQKHGAWTAVALIAMALVTAACVLVLTGVIQLPPGMKRYFGADGGGQQIPSAPPEGVPVVSELMAGNQKTLEASQAENTTTGSSYTTPPAARSCSRATSSPTTRPTR